MRDKRSWTFWVIASIIRNSMTKILVRPSSIWLGDEILNNLIECRRIKFFFEAQLWAFSFTKKITFSEQGFKIHSIQFWGKKSVTGYFALIYKLIFQVFPENPIKPEMEKQLVPKILVVVIHQCKFCILVRY